jgi:uncharacterized membrane protein (UPF0127 family)
MSALIVDGREVARVEQARTFAERSRGLLGRRGVDTGLVLKPAASVHTFGMAFAIDVAYVDRSGRVLAVRTMAPQRLGLPRWRSRWILETEAGRMARWGVVPGAVLTLEGT